jgi:Protein of unknown function (DUF2442)
MSSAPWRINQLRVLEPRKMWVQFNDGLAGEVQFAPPFFRGVFSHLADDAAFKQAQLINGAVTWPGELDLAPDAMYAEIKAHGHWLIDR